MPATMNMFILDENSNIQLTAVLGCLPEQGFLNMVVPVIARTPFALLGILAACCAKGKIGLKRQLSVDEISDQVLYFQASGVRTDSVSFMGMQYISGVQTQSDSSRVPKETRAL